MFENLEKELPWLYEHCDVPLCLCKGPINVQIKVLWLWGHTYRMLYGHTEWWIHECQWRCNSMLYTVQGCGGHKKRMACAHMSECPSLSLSKWLGQVAPCNVAGGITTLSQHWRKPVPIYTPRSRGANQTTSALTQGHNMQAITGLNSRTWEAWNQSSSDLPCLCGYHRKLYLWMSVEMFWVWLHGLGK